jgi:formamidopyrimidine-DNA glycosylase
MATTSLVRLSSAHDLHFLGEGAIVAGKARYLYREDVPELPDIVVYIERLADLYASAVLRDIRLFNPFLLRSVEPPLAAAKGRVVVGFERLGKRVVFALEGELFLVIHLMIAGRLHRRGAGAKGPGRAAAAFDFDDSSIVLTEAATKKRASLHVVAGREALQALGRGGLEVLEATPEAFAAALRRESHTLKRALTDPSLFSGIGNAYSDEILHAARLSPLALTQRLAAEDVARLFAATQQTLRLWIERLRAEAAGGFPEKVTAFREGMAVHGRFRQACPACGTAVQRIVYADNECDYCPRCQTEGRLLADRSLSRLLKQDWPRTVEELENRRPAGSKLR